MRMGRGLATEGAGGPLGGVGGGSGRKGLGRQCPGGHFGYGVVDTGGAGGGMKGTHSVRPEVSDLAGEGASSLWARGGRDWFFGMRRPSLATSRTGDASVSEARVSCTGTYEGEARLGSREPCLAR